MPRYQLHVAAALAGTALCSWLILCLTRRPSEGKLQLPTTQGTSLEDELKHDPFDVTNPEDIVDGEPIDEDAFWRKMRLWKLVLAVVFSTILVLEAVCLGWSATEQERSLLIEHALRTASALYLAALSIRSINQCDAAAHAKSVIHLAILAIISTLLLFTTAILPSPESIPSATRQAFPALLPLWYCILALYVVAMIISSVLPQGPPLHFNPSLIYFQKTIDDTTNLDPNNVSGITNASIVSFLFFNFTTRVVKLGNTAASLEIGDLPILPGSMRAAYQFRRMRQNLRATPLQPGWDLAWRIVKINKVALTVEVVMAVVASPLWYGSPYFLQKLLGYLESDPLREDRGWGWVFVVAQVLSIAVVNLMAAQMFTLANQIIQTRVRTQLNTVLFAKTLVKKDIVSSSAAAGADDTKAKGNGEADGKEKEKDDDDFSSKAQIMTLMTTDLDRICEVAFHIFTIVDSPLELVIGTFFLYGLLGVSCFFGLAVIVLFLPLNHFAGKVIVTAQENLMKARDERVSLMNEILGAIRMLKFMAWERSFEKRVLKIRDKELKYQKLNYRISVLFSAIWEASPLVVTLVSFFHFAVWRRQTLTPSIAFTSMVVFQEMRFAFNALPETFINILQSIVSLKRIAKYLQLAEVNPVPSLASVTPDTTIAIQSATITWPQDRSKGSSAASTPRQKFVLVDLALSFPEGELSLVCGKLGSGKTLLLLALLGEADVLTGQVICPRSPPDALASFVKMKASQEDWIVPGVCAYVPQAAWLRNASIKDNILFSLPYDEERYQKTLEVCALVSDLNILEDGDESEIGERGVNLSGGQKARVSLARAVYSRASILLLDDVLSAVDAHTAHHLYYECIKGDLMRGRTIILVSHHVQLCSSGASYIVALDNGRLLFEGSQEAFYASPTMATVMQSSGKSDEREAPVASSAAAENAPEADATSETSSTAYTTEDATPPKVEKKAPRKLVEDEKRAVGRVSKDVWMLYVKSCGGYGYWVWFGVFLVLGTLTPVAENWWLKTWSGATPEEAAVNGPVYYISIFAAVTLIGVLISTYRYFVLYNGSIHASSVLYQKLLETVLFANIRFHDTVSRGRLLNRFGKDFEGIDSRLADHFGRSLMYALSFFTIVISITFAGGIPFFCAALVLGYIYFDVAKLFSRAARDMRRLDSVSRSPIYSIYGETIAGVTILRAFGASSKFMRDMMRCTDSNMNPNYWQWGVNRWLSARYDLLSAATVGLIGFIAVLTPSISASLAGFALAFASTMTFTLLFLVRRFVALEQSMVALERVKEYSDLKREPAEFIEPRPPASWPDDGAIKCEDLVIRYSPELPDVLHKLNFEIRPGEKVGILGRTGSGKSTLALSFFRFVEATEGRITVDGLDIAKIGLTDLRSKLTIIPQDPTILSGTLRSTLDVFDEYEDAEIHESLRRVHLTPSFDSASSTPTEEEPDNVNANVFRNLESPVSEGGENFSTGEKQLLCMARAILKRSKVLVMDEATASVDYATDELIGKTIRQEFASSTILTIAHRLRTVIDYDRVMILDEGRIVEFNSPATLLSDPSSRFYGLCKATGKSEFATLMKMAGV
ncbi:P-loop containing nucleoside triphosphate hydrolase protein [Leucogyrophana mollusca]|uniref:P-loop containing nucleoside triphosphate hydrolase protein n=1 Tax=Leucogyrophana mollusca TaxID=85980 RepID=A0ACB8BN33_9AGAM|nr:P-loop containing nucleoside triphosphate hydrolase protein [Leucogyrophana mollusca]